MLIITSSNLDSSFTPYTALFPLEDDEGPGTSSGSGTAELGPAVAVSAVVEPAEIDVTEMPVAEAVMPKGTGKCAMIVASSIVWVIIVLYNVVSLDRRTSPHRDVQHEGVDIARRIIWRHDSNHSCLSGSLYKRP